MALLLLGYCALAAAPAICPDCTLVVRPIFSEDCSQDGQMPSATLDELVAAILACVRASVRVLNLSNASRTS
jgi:hypothetical protein